MGELLEVRFSEDFSNGDILRLTDKEAQNLRNFLRSNGVSLVSGKGVQIKDFLVELLNRPPGETRPGPLITKGGVPMTSRSSFPQMQEPVPPGFAGTACNPFPDVDLGRAYERVAKIVSFSGKYSGED
mmetsp:Transcript_18498/g.26865  ORF Transcript_18498/g.26865 Transcript_18498/m.26865 type:complete len:128 (-) Transcript_18498:517-900(-)